MASRSTAAAHGRAFDDWAESRLCCWPSPCCGAAVTALCLALLLDSRRSRLRRLVSCWHASHLRWRSARDAARLAADGDAVLGRTAVRLPDRLDAAPSFPIAWATSSPNVVGGLERTEARHGGGIGEVPLVLGDADEIANGGIGRPGAPQRRLGQVRRHARLQEGADVAAGRDGLDRRQARRIERRLRAARRCSAARSPALCSPAIVAGCAGWPRLGRLAPVFVLLGRLALQARPACDEVLGSLIARPPGRLCGRQAAGRGRADA